MLSAFVFLGKQNLCGNEMNKMQKKINAYFGNAYVRCFVLFSWCENITSNNACNTDEINL